MSDEQRKIRCTVLAELVRGGVSRDRMAKLIKTGQVEKWVDKNIDLPIYESQGKYHLATRTKRGPLIHKPMTHGMGRTYD